MQALLACLLWSGLGIGLANRGLTKGVLGAWSMEQLAIEAYVHRIGRCGRAGELSKNAQSSRGAIGGGDNAAAVSQRRGI